MLKNRPARNTMPVAPRRALLFLGLALVSGCLGTSSEDQTSAELLVVYSGDVRGYYEPCG